MNVPMPSPDGWPTELPDLVVHGGNLPATVRAMRTVLASADDLFDRGGVPVHLDRSADGRPPACRRLTPNAVTMHLHRLCRPVRVADDDKMKGVTLPERAARMWLETGEWRLRPLAGVATAPVLLADGGVLTRPGYDPDLKLWCEPVPDLSVPAHPTRDDALAALALLRDRFATFPFADAVRVRRDGLELVDLAHPPGLSESSFLAALLTAICRPSLRLAPGLLISAPSVSGAGSGKGLLARAICAIAYGVQPAAFTCGHDRAELDKRLVAELIEAGPAVFLDNVNATALRSDMLASVLTERPARVRIMGVSETVLLNSAAFIALTGNGLSVSEDLARRFLSVDLNPRCDNPEERPFARGFADDIRRDRAALLSAGLTIWRWGRQVQPPSGLVLGSFEDWACWCRDPLLALGCADPVRRIRDAKANDPQRLAIAALFEAWWTRHADAPVTAAGLAPELQAMLNPHGRGRQYLAKRLGEMAGTRGAGFVLTTQPPAGKWTATTYALQRAKI